MEQEALIFGVISLSILVVGALTLYRNRDPMNLLHIGPGVLVILGAAFFYPIGGLVHSTVGNNTFLLTPLLSLGIAFTAVGIYGLRSEKPVFPTALVAGLVPILITTIRGRWAEYNSVVLSLLLGILMGIGTWVGLKRRIASE